MKEDMMKEILRSLPREKASEGFTELVIRRIAVPVRRRPASRSGRVLATAAAIAIVLTSMTTLARREEKQLAALRLEQQQLELEIQRIRQETPQVPSVIRFEADNGVTYVVDLRESDASQHEDNL